MSVSRDNTPELNRDEYTDYIYDVTCFGDPINPENAEDVASGISRAMEQLVPYSWRGCSQDFLSSVLPVLPMM